jgi:GNAT superfamily N-acetyltransferase
MMTELHYRLATPADIRHLGALIEASIRGLQTHDYSPTQIEQAIGTWLGLDTQLVADQTYYAVEVQQNPDRLPTIGNLAACGGWSRRRTPYGSDHRPNRDDSLLDPRTDAAKIRAFFVHPAWARRGIGSRILELCEQAAQSEGFTRFEMGATLTGIPLYRRHGYVEMERIELPLANGDSLPIVKMSKSLQSQRIAATE